MTFGVRRQSAAATALCRAGTPRRASQSGVALRLPPHSKAPGVATQCRPSHGLLSISGAISQRCVQRNARILAAAKVTRRPLSLPCKTCSQFMSADTKKPLVGILTGSKADWEVMQHCARQLEELNVPWEAQAISAHRAPD